ncbi:KR domain-containing protein [Daldinia bambusicola]|nr:KR domain-containing protein [Daldinia bambusicola]
MSGRVDTRDKTATFDFSGMVTAIGDNVDHIKADDRVVDAHTSRIGIAAITLAQRISDVVYTTAGSQTKRHYQMNEMGILSTRIFSSCGPSFVQAGMQGTGGSGVAWTSLSTRYVVGGLIHESWRCLGEFGRLVEIGKRELGDAGGLDMRVFLRNATFTAFEMSELFYAWDPLHRTVGDQLMVQALRLYRAGEIQPLPMRVAPATYLSVFDAEKVYLLVGCLGGLGRSLRRWMMARGTPHFVFLGRSGADEPSAKQLMSRLEEAGATVRIVRGNISTAADVTAAISACMATGRCVGDIIQVTMGLHETLFTRMPNEGFLKVTAS